MEKDREELKECFYTNNKAGLHSREIYIKELGYWLDGYDSKRNVVCEYYEKQHKYHLAYDEKRKTDIIEFLKCKMIIIYENGKKEIIG